MRGFRGLALGLVLAASFGSGSWAIAQSRPPIEAFAELPVLSDPELSPDGRYVAWLQAVAGRPVVAIYEVGKEVPPVAIPSDKWVISGLRWVKNDRLAVFLSTGKKVFGDSKNLLRTWGRTVVMSPTGDDMKVLLAGQDSFSNNVAVVSIADIALDQPDHIYMPFSVGIRDGMDFRRDLLKVDVRRGSGVRYLTGGKDTVHWFMDGQGRVIARLDRIEKPKLEEVLLAPDGDTWREMGRFDAQGSLGAGVAGLTSDAKGLVRLASSGGTYAAVRLDIETKKQTVLFQDPAYDVSDIIEDEWTGRAVGVTYDGEKREVVYFDPDWKKMQGALERAFPGLTVRAVSVSRDLNTAIVTTEAPRSPPKFYFLDRTTREATEIANAYPALSEGDLGEMKSWPYKARDGLTIPAYITMPPGRGGKNLPMVVMPHGGPDTRDRLAFDWWAQFLANRGYVVLQPNFRGSAGYGHAFNAAGHGQWGLKVQDDITDGVRKAIADGIADPTRVCIVGASFGGYAALAGATMTPELYACAVSVAGISDLPVMLAHVTKVYGRTSKPVAFWASRMGSNDTGSEKLRAASPARLAAAVRAPVLLMHPELDTTVPIKQSELMRDALEDADKPVTFVKLKGDDHYLQLGATRLQMLRELEVFLAEHIGG